MIGGALYGMNADSIYLSPAPLYHAAPLGWSMAVLTLGGTVVLMQRFDPERALEFVEKYHINIAQWVPTHFVRMLKLPQQTRAKYDVSSLKAVFHAAAPCPVPVKQQMIDWWGPIVHEYYAGTEGNGFTAINSQEWLTHRGSVGKGLTAQVMICDEEGAVLPARAEGLVFFAGGGEFEYHNDPEKDRRIKEQAGLVDAGGRWLSGRGRLSLPHGSQELHDHLRRGEHLSGGDRKPAHHSPQGGGRGRSRRAA